jgi:hypothetical protein
MIPSETFVITFVIMAVTGVTSADQDAVGAFLESFDYEGGIYPAGTHHTDHVDVGGVFDSGCTGEIGTGIGTPVT